METTYQALSISIMLLSIPYASRVLNTYCPFFTAHHEAIHSCDGTSHQSLLIQIFQGRIKVIHFLSRVSSSVDIFNEVKY